MLSVLEHYKKIARANPIRQMNLFGSVGMERSDIHLRHNMYLLERAIDRAAEDCSNYLNKKYNLV